MAEIQKYIVEVLLLVSTLFNVYQEFRNRKKKEVKSNFEEVQSALNQAKKAYQADYEQFKQLIEQKKLVELLQVEISDLKKQITDLELKLKRCE